MPPLFLPLGRADEDAQPKPLGPPIMTIKDGLFERLRREGVPPMDRVIF